VRLHEPDGHECPSAASSGPSPEARRLPDRRGHGPRRSRAAGRRHRKPTHDSSRRCASAEDQQCVWLSSGLAAGTRALLPVTAASPRSPRTSPAHFRREFRHAVLAGCSSVPRIPGPKSPAAQHPGRDLLEFCRDREADVTRFSHDTRIWPTSNISGRGVRPRQNPAENLGQAHQPGSHPGPAGYPQLHRHRPQARPQRHERPAQRHDRGAMVPARPGARRITTSGPSPAVGGWPHCYSSRTS
jgi:hypothetical protein